MKWRAFVASMAVTGAAFGQQPPAPAPAPVPAPAPAVPGTEPKPAEPKPKDGLFDEPGDEMAGKTPGYRAAGFPAEPPAAGTPLTRLRITGFLAPLVAVQQRDAAVPRDRLTLGVLSTRAGLRFKGNPFEQWSYFVEIGFDATVLNNRTGAQKILTDVSVDQTASGGTSTHTTYTFITAVPVEQATITWSPSPYYDLTIGRMRAPFSVGHGATITAQMFPTRPGPTSVFMSGADEGLLNTVTLIEERMQIRAGVFNGSSLGLQLPNTTPIGPVLSLFTDVHPLGKMPSMEGDSGRGPFRFAGGIGMLYRIGTLYDDTGYEATRFRDFRLSAALRAAWRGLFVQGEYLRRLQTDDLSLRPSSAHGTYGQVAWYVPIVDRYAFAPIGRLGYSTQDEEYAKQTTTSYEAGVIFYPRADLKEPDAIRITLQYAGEQRTPAKEIANGAILHMLMKW